MMTREEALVLLKENINSPNLLKHMYACEAIMQALARYFAEDEVKWGLAGLLHDIDYQKTQDRKFAGHGSVGARMLEELGFPPDLTHAVEAHNSDTKVELESLFDRCLYATDPVSGLIVAGALILPAKKLAVIDADFLYKRFYEKGFAKGANREQIASCESFGFELRRFLALALEAMQGISAELGL